VINICKFCGSPAEFQRKDRSWCCSKNSASCPEIKKKMKQNHADVNGDKNPMFGKKMSKESIKLAVEKRKGQLIWNKGKTGVYSEETLELMSFMKKLDWKNPNSRLNSPEVRILWSNQRTGKTAWNKGLKILNEIILEKISKGGKKSWNNDPERRKRQSKLLKDGLALKMIKAIKQISNEEIKIREMVKQLYPNCEYQYQVLNYSLDVSLVEEKIAIEYDGYYHFNCQKSIDYYLKRKKKIEDKGWKFIQYNMFRKLPKIEEIKKDIEKLLINNF